MKYKGYIKLEHEVEAESEEQAKEKIADYWDDELLVGFDSSSVELESENKGEWIPVGVENYTVEKLNQILKWGYCFCDTDDNEFCKAIKNAIEIISALELLKAEIRDNTSHCECVPNGSCIRVDKALEIIDKHISGEWNKHE